MTMTLPQISARLPRVPRVQRVERTAPMSGATLVVSSALTILSVTLLTMLFNLAVVSQLQHHTAQQRLYKELRLSLAEGSTPIGQVAGKHLVDRGTPMALLTVPALGIREVVVEGASSRETKIGVGHRPDTPLPGQPGVSVLMGRATAYGGIFGRLDRLKAGDTFSVTTGQGVAQYKVIGQRVPGTKLPALGATDGRIMLETATGSPLVPHGVLDVDAQLVSKAFVPPPAAVAPGSYAKSEAPLAGDRSGISMLCWLMELLVLALAGSVWAWKRWSHPASWVVCAPVLAAVALATADHVSNLLPNLL